MKRKPTKARRKTPSRKSPTSLPIETRQLAVYHNPFARTTKQPKIPDGKVTESLGFQTQAVRETVAATGGDGILHMLLYPGQDAGLIITGDQQSNAAFTTQKYNVVGFTSSNNLNWSTLTTSGGTATKSERYALWRTVSQGMKLSLLNPAEEDDGWWEAIRVTEPRDPQDFALFTRDSLANRSLAGTIAPLGKLENLKNDNLVNERSYATGLLRDLKDFHFNLNGITDHHDFRQQMTSYFFGANGTGTYDATDVHLPLTAGYIENQNMVNQWVDPGYDMIYVRIHGRTAGNLSRLHVNVVSNQEITFDQTEKESRFQTGSANIGASAISAHATAKRANGAAAHIVAP
mgnify:CR=1 FL=1